MNISLLIQTQLLATKLYIPVAPGTLIWRPRLSSLLAESLKHSLTLISAPAGFGKTMALSSWAQSLPASQALVAWISLDEEDNEPRLFWTYVLSALDQQQAERFTPLLKYLQSPEAPSLRYILTALINGVLDSQEHLVLILDDYHLITEPQVHATLSYLIEHLPPHLHIILATRADPPLALSQLRAHQQVLEIRAEQLRCTMAETKAFFKEAKGIHLPDDMIQKVIARTEGWLVGLQLLGLSLSEQTNPATLLQELSGDQRYILDYLTEEALRQQPQDMQTFLLSTCILERLTASLCDAVMQQDGSQQMLERLEQANLFVVSLDSRRQWYRYHPLFAEALQYHLEQTQGDFILILHYRASLWYAEHEQATQAILHALRAKKWQWAANLIEQKLLPLVSETWRASLHEIVQMRDWLKQLPVDVVHARPQLCLASALLLLMVTPSPMLEGWLDVAEATLSASLGTQIDEDSASPVTHQQNLLGAVIGLRTVLRTYEGDEQASLELSQRAFALFSPDNALFRAQLLRNEVSLFYLSSLNNAETAIEKGLQGVALAQAAGESSLVIGSIGSLAMHMIGAGKLHETQQLIQQAKLLGVSPGISLLPDLGYPDLSQAELLREWNHLEEARSLAEEALLLCEQSASMVALAYVLYGYMILLRIALSQGDLEEARSALQQSEDLGMHMNQPLYQLIRSLFTTIDQVRLWLACEELDRATHWAKDLDMAERHGNSFAHEREEVACSRVHLANKQPHLALRRLEPVLQRATAGQRWGHIIEIRLLQALAHQMLHEVPQALSVLSEAIRLAEPEGYIRSFVDEGVSMVALLSQLREQQCKAGPTPYLDTLLAAFEERSKTQKHPSKKRKETRKDTMNPSTLLQSQLLATKFYIPVAPGRLISRPRLSTLLDRSLIHPFTLVSAPAGFGKTTLLSFWAQSLPAHNPRLCWVSLDEEDNEPRLFWSYVLTALQMQCPQRFQPLLMHLQSQPPPPLKSLLTALINLLAEGTDHFVLILDDYQVITEEQVHTTLAYLIGNLPAQLRLILATRADPPLPLPLLRAHQQALEVRTEQLRCTAEEVKAFFGEVMSIQVPEETIQQVTLRTEGWLVGLHLLGLSLPKRADPLTLLQEISGDQRYILDYLTQEVLERQSQEVQTFLLSTCILGRLTASLCDAVMQQDGSQRMLARLEQTNLFVVSLDNKRQWYRYHPLFAEALHHHLEQTQGDFMLILHHRASLWYAEHDQTTEAILHALKAHQWQWAADLIERKSLSLMTFSWGASQHQLALLQQWLEQLPAEAMRSRPRLCLACAHMLYTTAPPALLDAWFDVAEATLTASLQAQTPENASSPILALPSRQEQEKLLVGVLTTRAVLLSLWEDQGPIALALAQRAHSLLSAENALGYVQVALSQILALYASSANDAMAAIEAGLHGSSLAQAAEQPALAISLMVEAICFMLGAGQLHEAQQLARQAMQLGSKPGESSLPDVGRPTVFQAEILREWNQLDAAYSLVQEGLALCQRAETMISLLYVICGYAVLLRISLSRGDLSAAHSALEQFEHISRSLNEPFSFHYRSLFTTIDQVRLWLACGELDRAMLWVKELEISERHGTPFAREREEVACARVHLAKDQPTVALQRLEPVLQRATAGQRWGHVIEIRLLQALAHQMCQQERQALDALSEAVRLAEPEDYIRSFVDEGLPMEALLYQLRRRNRKNGPTPYLDMLLAAFQQETKPQAQPEESAQIHQLPEPLSQREREVLQLLASGASNQEIAQELVITVDTVKRHVSHIFAKLGVSNRVQAVRQARECGLLVEEV